MALANRIEPLAKEVILYIEETRRIQVEALMEAMRRSGAMVPLAPPGLALLASSVALAMTRERHLGITDGHADVMSWAETFIGSLD
jgi:hypothetical protein